MIIMGVDPGITCGFCVIEFIPHPIFYHPILALELRGDPPEVAAFIAKQTYDFCAIESFLLVTKYAEEVSQRDPNLLTVRVIGGLEVLIPREKRVFQNPSTKNYTPDTKLKELGLYHGSRHCRDAFRHAVFFSRRFINEQHSNKKISLPDFYSA